MIKRLLLTLVLVLIFPALVLAQTWYTANQVTVAWDPVIQLVSGDIIPSGNTIKYQVYTRVGTTGSGAPVGGEITATQLAITFSIEGRYYVGVKTIRYPVGETVGIPSDVSWSNDPLVCAAAGPFGIVYYVKPAGIKGLRTVP